MSQPQDPQLATNPLYLRHAERAKADKPPNRSSPLGAVAQARFPSASRREMMDGILAQDRDLAPGSFGTVYYKPVTVCGIELKLEPVQPSIGTSSTASISPRISTIPRWWASCARCGSSAG